MLLTDCECSQVINCQSEKHVSSMYLHILCSEFLWNLKSQYIFVKVSLQNIWLVDIKIIFENLCLELIPKSKLSHWILVDVMLSDVI